MARILLLNGPNLNLLGTREPDIYGTVTLQQVQATLAGKARARGHEVLSAQSNAEHELVGRVQSARADGVMKATSAAARRRTRIIERAPPA